MKHLILKLSCIITMLCVLAVDGTTQPCYFSGGRAIPLQIDSNRVTIRFDDNLEQPAQAALLDSIERIEGWIPDDHTIDGFAAYTLTTGAGYDSFLDSLSGLSGIELVEP